MAKKRHPLVFTRRLTQTLVLAAFIYIIWTTRYPLQGFVNPMIFFHIDPLVMGITALAERVWLPGMIWALVMLALTWVFGRFFCGWMCPLGALMDATGALGSRVRRWREREPGKGQTVKYGLLGIIAALGLAGVQYVWFFDPLTIFMRAFSFNVHPAVVSWVDRGFAWALNATRDWAPLETFYYRLKESVLDVNLPVFPHSGLILLVFSLILASVFIRRRFWCRYLCPLGALLGLAARFTLFRRTVSDCRGQCSLCRHVCRTNAIRADNSYFPQECVLCFDCVAVCPGKKTVFTFRRKPSALKVSAAGGMDSGQINRAQFLQLLGGSLLLAGGFGRRAYALGTGAQRGILRPPGALPEAEFLQRCVRCGNCMKVCPTHVLQPAVLESGWEGVWTPRLAPSLGYCEYQCNLCGRVCPTGALRPLTVAEKTRTRLGLAEVHRDRCIPWTTDEQCLVCEEHCPVPAKAIKILEQRNERGKLMRRPVVDAGLCVGCAICENKCPVTPGRAITVRAL